MKDICFSLLLTLVFFSACTSKPENQSSSLSNLENSTTSPFSDTLKLDTFKVTLKENTVKGNSLLLKIISYEGKLIYQAVIKTDELMTGGKTLKTEQDKITFLKNEVKYFFEDEHFLWPAVMPSEAINKHVTDKEFYKELKETALNGFNYRIGAESKVFIAWSKKDQKVKVYYKL